MRAKEELVSLRQEKGHLLSQVQTLQDQLNKDRVNGL